MLVIRSFFNFENSFDCITFCEPMKSFALRVCALVSLIEFTKLHRDIIMRIIHFRFLLVNIWLVVWVIVLLIVRIVVLVVRVGSSSSPHTPIVYVMIRYVVGLVVVIIPSICILWIISTSTTATTSTTTTTSIIILISSIIIAWIIIMEIGARALFPLSASLLEFAWSSTTSSTFHLHWLDNIKIILEKFIHSV